MHPIPRALFRPKSLLFAVALAGAAAAWAAGPDEAPFLAENNAAMTKMMAAMSIKPTGDVDRDFVLTHTQETWS